MGTIREETMGTIEEAKRRIADLFRWDIGRDVWMDKQFDILLAPLAAELEAAREAAEAVEIIERHGFVEALQTSTAEHRWVALLGDSTTFHAGGTLLAALRAADALGHAMDAQKQGKKHGDD